MRNSVWVFVFYYIYAICIVLATGYVVFYLNQSGWWFLLTVILLQITPSVKNEE